jgi:isopenicillin N synthase-like dioxygenase
MPSPRNLVARAFLTLHSTQWPEESLLPGFRDAFTRYINALQKLSYELLSFVAESLELAPNAFAHFFEAEGNEDRGKIVKYPAPTDDSSDQGVGPHFDGGFLTLVSVSSRKM